MPVGFTDDEKAWLQSELGAAVDLTDAYGRFQRHQLADAPDPLRATAAEIIRTRLSNLLTTPATFNAEGDYSQSTGENIKAYQAQLTSLRAGLDLPEGGDELPIVNIVPMRQPRWLR